MKKVLSLMLALVLLFSFSGIGGAKGNGAIDPYALGLQALQAKDGITDLYINVTPELSDYTAPDSLKKVQLKSYNLDGELAYTRNYNGGVASPNGQAIITLDDVLRYQPLETLVVVQNEQTISSKVLNAETTVLFRPDLVVDEITAPPVVHVNQSFSVNTIIKELNGDLGAETEVQILNGSSVLDTANSVMITAGGQESVNHMISLSQVGQYTLTVKAANVNPGDYDDSNNEKTFTVDVIEPNKPLNYWSQYYYMEDYNSYSSNYYSTNHYSSTHEQFYVQTWTNDQYKPTSLDITLTNENGNQVAVQITSITGYDNGGNYHFNAYDPATSTWVSGYSSPSGTTTYAQTTSGYYSENWQDYYGSSSSYSGSYGGSLLGAKSSVDVNLDILSDDGTHFGGNYNISLTPNSYSWDYHNWSWYWYTTHYWGSYNQYYGNSSGVTVW